jgi:hypothetical protein
MEASGVAATVDVVLCERTRDGGADPAQAAGHEGGIA